MKIRRRRPETALTFSAENKNGAENKVHLRPDTEKRTKVGFYFRRKQKRKKTFQVIIRDDYDLRLKTCPGALWISVWVPNIAGPMCYHFRPIVYLTAREFRAM